MTKFLTLLLMLAVSPVFADVRLPKIIGSQMVLQRESDVKLWGWAGAGEKITVSGDWLDHQTSTTADAAGHWQLIIKTAEAGKPHTITIQGKNRIVLSDVLFGEVWLASGQSNMEMPLASVSGSYTGIDNAKQEIAAADHPQIRLFQVGNYSSRQPLDDVETGIEMYGVPPAACKWQVCSPKTIRTFAAAAYFFARELNRQLKVPVGIIDSSWGGTEAESWVPVAGLQELGETKILKRTVSVPQRADLKLPSRLYNGMIYPLRNFRIRGVIWYQGEGNTMRAAKYHKLFSTMIDQWRKAFGYEFPFYFVQIAPFNYNGVNAAFLREAQLETLALPKTHMVVTMDLVGNLANIHPKDKQEMGRRLALCALADAGRKVVYSGPIYKASQFKDGKARLTFEHVGSGLVSRFGKPLSNFEIAGPDKKFHPATAVIQDDTVVVSSDKVADPKAVRYAFTSNAQPNLQNKEGLPASPFRTDRW